MQPPRLRLDGGLPTDYHTTWRNSARRVFLLFASGLRATGVATMIVEVRMSVDRQRIAVKFDDAARAKRPWHIDHGYYTDEVVQDWLVLFPRRRSSRPA